MNSQAGLTDFPRNALWLGITSGAGVTRQWQLLNGGRWHGDMSTTVDSVLRLCRSMGVM